METYVSKRCDAGPQDSPLPTFKFDGQRPGMLADFNRL